MKIDGTSNLDLAFRNWWESKTSTVANGIFLVEGDGMKKIQGSYDYMGIDCPYKDTGETLFGMSIFVDVGHERRHN